MNIHVNSHVNTSRLRRPSVLLALAALLACGTWLLWRLAEPATDADAGATGSEPAGLAVWLRAGTGAASAPARPVFHTGLENLPRSLSDIEPAGELQEDAQGRLVVTRGLRDRFDYFLAARGEEPDAVLHARLRAHLASQLKPPAAAEAQALLDRYLAYLAELDTAFSSLRADTLDDLRTRLATLERLRSTHFSPQVQTAFFADDLAYDRYSLAKLDVMADTSLNAQQKATRLRELRAALPEALRENMAAAEQVQTLDALTQQWQASGGSPAELRALREGLVGPAAADRLEALDREDAEWAARLAAYRQERARLQADASLADAERQRQLQALLDTRFSAPERVRVGALERIAAAPSALPPIK